MRLEPLLPCLLMAGCLFACTQTENPLWLSGNPHLRPEGKPACEYRILDHWDNLDNSVERGYAGPSIWDWESEEIPRQRIRQYGRLNRSIGINGCVLNNVNANPKILDEAYLERVADIADILRRYGIRVYLSVNFASPQVLDGLPTADPLAPDVARWWREKTERIYALIPDFGGFLVKASSEGQPGPQNFGRTHVEGANMIAAALEPHGGILMWRAFVYRSDGGDRAAQAYEEFKPLDGSFAGNVLIQIKNGPVDFQPREPVSPLFFGLEQTRSLPELQITQEYLGQDKMLCYLAPMWKECLDTLARYGYRPEAMAGVANTGTSPDGSVGCGHPFADMNWYAFGRLAWDPDLSAETIAREWLELRFRRPKHCRKAEFESRFVEPVLEMMLSSREACVDFMTPMGLHHLMAWNHHYGPDPGCWRPGAREDWLPRYYHRAAADGIGFDRSTGIGGSGAVAQYPQALADIYGSPESCPEEYLLWFHHLPWDYVLDNGQTLWDALADHYGRGVAQAESYVALWDSVRDCVADTRLWEKTSELLKIQAADAARWRDVCLDYFDRQR